MPIRPHSISDLAQFARDDSPSTSRSIKDWLRVADALRKQGQQANGEGDIQAAFVYYARSATYILEKIPRHPSYEDLNDTQKNNLKSNGHEILHNLEQLKPRLADRYENWLAKDPNNINAPSELQAAYGTSISPVVVSRARRQESYRENTPHARAAVSQAHESPTDTIPHARSFGDLTREMNGLRIKQSPVEERRAMPMPRQTQDDEARRQWQEQAVLNRRREEENMARMVAAQDEANRRQWDFDELERQREEQQRRPSEYDRTQQVRHTLDAARQAAMNSNRYTTQSSRYQEGSMGTSQPPLVAQTSPRYDGLPHHPLQDPSLLQKYDSSTSPSWHGNQTPTVARLQPVYSQPAPLETSFPSAHIQYPQLMSAHQRAQGYQPTIMFPSPNNSRGGSNLYNVPLPQHPQPIYYPPRSSSIPQSRYSPAPPAPQPTTPHADTYSYNNTSPVSSRPQQRERESQAPPAHRRQASVPEVAAHPLGFRPIDMPVELLEQFLGVARLNTLRKVETCGLLLGKERGNSFTISTLLIPEQRGTQDTCMMEGEELVVEFSTGRDLLTLGWIHTHPTQSCFMSSLDLHTHAAYQSTLKEAIAIVCAPASEPKFGIFRLTDPPGLDIVMNCRAKESFHPHPGDMAIYTDCDGAHVRLVSGMHLEIVDLRNRHDFSSASEGTRD
ncbi:hypothetical protein FRB91_009346 [Serendipita sp. 411]|nr:hypothetical protein FRB91_009346 [Serendipita sp. 411]